MAFQKEIKFTSGKTVEKILEEAGVKDTTQQKAGTTVIRFLRRRKPTTGILRRMGTTPTSLMRCMEQTKD